MIVNADLLPRGGYLDVVVLIDTLRAGTVAPILFERQLQELALTPSLKLARALDGRLLLGEREGVPPEGFNYGISPAALRGLDLDGQRAVLVSENAPTMLSRVQGARHVLLASLYNAAAATTLALQLAEARIDLVCCGFGGAEDLDDTLTAGVLASEIARRAPDTEFVGGAGLAVSLLRAFPEPLEALWQSRAGHYLRRLELEQDIGICALVAHSEVVPAQVGAELANGTPVYRFAAQRAAPV